MDVTPAEALAKVEQRKRAPRNKKSVSKKLRHRPCPFKCGCRELRESLGLTAYSVSKACGIAIAALFDIEAGCGLRLETAFKLANFYGKPIEELWCPVEDEVRYHLPRGFRKSGI